MPLRPALPRGERSMPLACRYYAFAPRRRAAFAAVARAMLAAAAIAYMLRIDARAFYYATHVTPFTIEGRMPISWLLDTPC